MNETLPQGWTEATILELSGIDGLMTDGDWIESKDQDPNGEVRLIQLADIGDGYFINKSNRSLTAKRANELRCTYLSSGDVLIARMPDPLGRACIFPKLDKKSITAVDVCIWRSGVLQIANPKWLMYSINSPKVRSDLNDLASGTTRKRVSGANLKAYKIPIPPLAEQQRIAAKLEALLTRSTNARNELAAIPKLIKRYKQAVLAAAFRGDLTADWRGTSELMGWEKSTVGDIAKVGTGATPKRGESKYYLDGTHPWVTSGALNNDFIDSADEYITDQALKETNCTLYPANTILLAMYGEGKTRGKSSILRITASTNQACAAIQVTNSHVSIAFINYFFKFNYLNIRSEAAGGVQPNLNLSIVKAIELSIPPPSEQAIIIERIETAFKAIDTIEAELTKAESIRKRLEQTILTKAFRGELVPQNPNDEPASVLLERIRAEREAQPKSKRTQRIKPAKKILSIQDEPTVMVERSNLLNVIKGAGKPVTPEELLRGSTYDEDTIEDFYAALKLAVESKQIVEDREGDKILLRSSS